MSDKIINGVHGCSEAKRYIPPKDSLVREKLEEFRDRKLGLMMHWAPVSQLGIVESWAMVDNDGQWSQKEIDWTEDMDAFRRQYRNLYKTFNPIRYEPKKWAKIAKESGFKYVLFTTKHHDGFCMWDTKTTDYKITSENCPFHEHRYKDIVKHLFNAFRDEGLGIHTYFSKPDWDCPYYWSKDFQWPNNKTDRNPNYDILRNKEIWESFIQYTHSQITELMTNYGKIDCLWLDGGWVNKTNMNQDIRLGEIVDEIRATTQPGLICADRTVGGRYENFITPEQSIPKEPILVPWESCITLSETFSFKYDSHYKSPRKIIHLLIDIVAKGGNLALNITPQPDGRLPLEGIKVLEELGGFLKTYGEGIYATRACAPYIEGKYAFTSKDNNIYVFYQYQEDEQIKNTYNIPILIDKNIERIELINSNEILEYKSNTNSILVNLKHEEKSITPYVEGFRIKIKK